MRYLRVALGAVYGICAPAAGRPLEPPRLDALAAPLAACGPHGGGRRVGDGAGLGAFVLRDTPEARHERQPLAGGDGRWVLVADARLDNRDELFPLLDLRTAPAETPDSAVILAAWERWGEACPDRLLGDFAFAVWDTRERLLFCARDPMGVKPFYYHWAPDGLGFLFASQLAGLLALDEMPRRLDRVAAAGKLLLLSDDKEHTLFADIRRLPPGHRLVVGPGRPPRLDRYWRPRPARGLGRLSLDGWAAALGAEIVRAVAASARSAGGVAAHLSGGLDSSAVTCLAARELERGGDGRRLLALSFSLPPEGDELVTGEVVDARFIEAVREFSAIAVHYHGFEPMDFDQLLAETAPGMMLPEYRTTPLHRWARDEGIRVLLSGWGGDEASSFNARGLPAELALTGRWRELWRLMRQLQRRRRIVSRRQFLVRRVVAPLLPAALLGWIEGSQGALAGLADVSPISDPLLREARAAGRLGAGRLELPSTRRMRRMLLENGHLAARIEAWSADASRFGLDYRYPLLDRRVLEVALAVPGRAFLQQGFVRWVFRQALVGRMPDAVLWRPGKLDSVVQRNQAARLEAARRHEWEMEEDPAGAGEPAEWLRKLLAEGDDLGGAIDLGKLRRLVDQTPPGGYSPAADISERLPGLGVGLLGTLVKLVEHNRIDCA